MEKDSRKDLAKFHDKGNYGVNLHN